jgi:hypothetical protein
MKSLCCKFECCGLYGGNEIQSLIMFDGKGWGGRIELK